MKQIIAIDFDGTIVDHQYPEIGELRSNAVKIINHLYDLGHTIIIWTVRSETDNKLTEMVEFLNQSGIRYHEVNQNTKSIRDGHWTHFSPKVYADVYIDDRQLGGLAHDWVEIYQTLHSHHDRGTGAYPALNNTVQGTKPITAVRAVKISDLSDTPDTMIVTQPTGDMGDYFVRSVRQVVNDQELYDLYVLRGGFVYVAGEWHKVIFDLDIQKL